MAQRSWWRGYIPASRRQRVSQTTHDCGLDYCRKERLWQTALQSCLSFRSKLEDFDSFPTDSHDGAINIFIYPCLTPFTQSSKHTRTLWLLHSLLTLLLSLLPWPIVQCNKRSLDTNTDTKSNLSHMQCYATEATRLETVSSMSIRIALLRCRLWPVYTIRVMVQTRSSDIITVICMAGAARIIGLDLEIPQHRIFQNQNLSWVYVSSKTTFLSAFRMMRILIE